MIVWSSLARVLSSLCFFCFYVFRKSFFVVGFWEIEYSRVYNAQTFFLVTFVSLVTPVFDVPVLVLVFTLAFVFIVRAVSLALLIILVTAPLVVPVEREAGIEVLV